MSIFICERLMTETDFRQEKDIFCMSEGLQFERKYQSEKWVQARHSGEIQQEGAGLNPTALDRQGGRSGWGTIL